jgi:hypothetical protein
MDLFNAAPLLQNIKYPEKPTIYFLKEKPTLNQEQSFGINS